MQSNYRKIGDYIELVDERNKDLSITNLLGLSINKAFIPSVANIIGSDMANYKIIRKGQFACSLMQVRRDGKIPVALLQEFNEAIISQAYPIFEIKNTDELLPEYMMMWMSRSEFDRRACFLAVGGVRGSLEWEDFCDMELPVPSIERQREIVKEYNVIVNRIKLNEQLNQKLEETAQTIYKQWFVDFEFPNKESKPYKSSGGEMVYNEELEQEIPKGWEYQNIENLIENKILYKNQDGNHGELHPKNSDYVNEGIPFIMAKDIYNGTLNLSACYFITKEKAQTLRIGFAKTGDVLLTHKATMGRVAIIQEINDYIVLTPQVTYYRIRNKDLLNNYFLYCLFASESFQNMLISESEQSTRNYMGITNQRLIKLILPKCDILQSFKKYVKPLFTYKQEKAIENIKLRTMSNLLLSSMASKQLEAVS